MISSPLILKTRVYHKRFSPKSNRFNYSLTYLALPLSKVNDLSIRPFFAINRRALMSFWNRDHGVRTQDDLRDWADKLLQESGIADVSGEIVLVTLPRLFGYVFNPVSFWLCYSESGELRAVIAEVNNTFGETHTYVCSHKDGQNISKDDYFYAQKDFHVSPFFSRKGYYRFRFLEASNRLQINIDYFDKNDKLLLVTSINGKGSSWSLPNLLKGWLSTPLMSFKAIALIHWQALKLVCKSAKYQSKPDQHRWFQTVANNVRPFSSQTQQQKIS